jgi:hypothetical protein
MDLRVTAAPALGVWGMVVRPRATTRSRQHSSFPGSLDRLPDVLCDGTAAVAFATFVVAVEPVAVDLAAAVPLALGPPPPLPFPLVDPWFALVVEVAWRFRKTAAVHFLDSSSQVARERKYKMCCQFHPLVMTEAFS